MRKQILAVSLLLAVLFTGCAGKAETAESTAVEETQTEAPAATEIPQTEKTAVEEKTQLTGKTNPENSILLFDRMTEGEENYVFSPLSLNFALGLVAEGASGKTKKEIDVYLGTEDYAPVAEAYLNYIGAQSKEQYVEELLQYVGNGFEGTFRRKINIANSLWVNRDRGQLTEDYKNRVENFYKAKVESFSFKDAKKITQKINSWCKGETGGMIPEIVSEEDFNEMVAIVLANALYFESPWQDEWNLDEDTESFSLQNGEVKKVRYLRSDGDRYYENEYATAFGSYYSDGKLFIGILPKQEGSFTLESLDIPDLLKNERTSDYSSIRCKMPELDFESEYDLKKALLKLGVSEMFSESAELERMTGRDDLYIGKAKQKAKIELNEKGTKAAAVTVMVGLAMAAPDTISRKAEVYLDRPYAFLIYDEAQEQILFLGKVADPSN